MKCRGIPAQKEGSILIRHATNTRLNGQCVKKCNHHRGIKGTIYIIYKNAMIERFIQMPRCQHVKITERG